jgi:GPH family glycoside/pentoside/hexuronide:cation symporter
MLPEVATSSRDRVGLVGLRVYCGVAGAAVGLVGSGLLVDRFGFRAMAFVVAALAFACRYLGMAGVWRFAERATPPADLPFRAAMRATFTNRAILLFLPTFVLFQIGLQLLTGVLPYYVNSVLGEEDEGTWTAVLTAVAIGAMVCAVPLFGRLARRTSKRQAFRWAMRGAAAAFPALAFAGFLPGVPALAQIVAVLLAIGVPLAGVYLFPTALTADIADDDAARTGMRREATYFGTQNFVEKLCTSVTPLLLAGLLALGNTAEDPLGIRLVGPAAGVVVLAGYLLFRGFDLPDEVPTRGADAGCGVEAALAPGAG